MEELTKVREEDRRVRRHIVLEALSVTLSLNLLMFPEFLQRGKGLVEQTKFMTSWEATTSTQGRLVGYDHCCLQDGRRSGVSLHIVSAVILPGGCHVTVHRSG